MATRKIVSIENAHIFMRNFSGAPTKFQPNGGVRSFCLGLDEDLANEMANDGWNVKWPRTRRDDEDSYGPYISVAVSFRFYPPEIVLITSSGQQKLDESTIGIIDGADIESVDLSIRPYNYQANGTIPAGVKAYLKTMYVTLAEDSIQRKYAQKAFESEMPF